MANVYADFKCDHCGSRYVVNPMRRGNKVSTTKYKVAPRHRIDPETRKILSLCNACGKFILSKLFVMTHNSFKQPYWSLITLTYLETIFEIYEKKMLLIISGSDIEQ